MKKMNIKETFLNLTRQTYPHGTEESLYDMLPSHLEKDDFGNLYIEVGDGTSDVMFTSHLDTATQAYTDVNHVIDGKMIKTDGKSILGADDKAGVTIMLHMIENNVPGLYYFFLGEEVGCKGSRHIADKHKVEKLDHIKKVISFDRRGLDSVITYQSSSRCCSDNFAQALAKELNKADDSFKYKKDSGGVYTDSAVFTGIYPECTNLSVGYYSEHTFNERQDIEHLEKMAKACLLVDWANLPIERDPSKTEYGGYGSYYGYGGHDDWGTESYTDFKEKEAEKARLKRSNSFDDDRWSHYLPSTVPNEKKVTFWDKKYNYMSSYTIDTKTGIYNKVDIDPRRIQDEFETIALFLEDLNVTYKSIKWNGVVLQLFHGNGSSAEDTTRNEMAEYLGVLELDKISSTISDTQRLLSSHKQAENYEDYC